MTLYREINRNGRGLCRICGVVMQVSVLKELAACLMDVHGQHEHRFLMDPTYHLSFLDATGGEEHQQLLRDTGAACAAFLETHRQYARLVRENEQKAYRMESLKKSLEELSKAKLRPGEEEQLTAERERLRHAGHIASAVQGANGELAGAERDPALTRVKLALSALQNIRGLGENYAALCERCETAYYELEEISFELNELISHGEFEPGREEQVEARLDLIRRLERKYGENIPAVLAAQEQMQEEYDHFVSMDGEVERLAAKDRKLLGEYRALAKRLTASRKELAAAFEVQMHLQLSDLGMERTVFSVAFLPSGEKVRMPQPRGDDQVEFMISANPGEPVRPLAKIASGGELSRLMLAIKSLEAEQGGVGCMVFDEIDTGISGRMAQVVAEKMALIARNRQVICVTHLPQLAAMAAHELLVEKTVENGRTNTHVRMLTEEERVQEIARMLGGADGSGDSARSHAKHMLEQAAAYRTQGGSHV